MNMLPSEVPRWVEALTEQATDVPAEAELLICAPFTHLPALQHAAFGTELRVGAQDISSEATGARTGEVSGAMLADLGITYVLVGHSERREYHREDNEILTQKLLRATEAGLQPIFCVGETLEEREAGNAESVVRNQLTALESHDLPGLVIAYEPVWAIGTGKTASASDANEMCAYIHTVLKTDGRSARVLYGGSMNPGNAAELLAQPAIQGGLIGGASLETDSFIQIARSIS